MRAATPWRMTARRSAGSWTLTTTGVTAHSGQIFKPEVGAGAVYEASRILDGFYTRLGGERYLTFNSGLALGGTLVTTDTTGTEGTAAGKRNVVPDRMVVTGDLRALTADQVARAQRTMRGIVGRHLPHTTAEITFDDETSSTNWKHRLLAFIGQSST